MVCEEEGGGELRRRVGARAGVQGGGGLFIVLLKGRFPNPRSPC